MADTSKIKKLVEDGFATVKNEYEAELDKKNKPVFKPNIISDTVDNYTQTRTVVFNCPECGKENTVTAQGNVCFTPQMSCACGYQGTGRYDYSDQYVTNTAIFSYHCKTFMVMITSSRDLMLDENHIGRTTAWKHEVKNVAICEAGTCQRFRVNNDIYTRTTTRLGNLFGYSAPVFLGGLTNVEGVVYLNLGIRIFYSDVEDALKTKKTTKTPQAPTVPTFTEYKLKPSDVAEFKITIETTDNASDEITGQVWCTSCNEVFDYKGKPYENSDGSQVYGFTCPNCGAHKEMPRYNIARTDETVLVVNELPDSFELLYGNADITDTWETKFDVYRGIKIDKTDPKVRLFQKHWSSTDWRPVKSDKYGGSFKKIVIAGTDTCNILNVFSRNEKDNWYYDKDVAVAKYIVAALKNPALAEIALQSDAAKRFRDLFSPYGKENANLNGQTYEEVFGVEDKFLEKYPNISIEDLKMFRDLDPNVDEDTLIFILTNRLNFWSVRKVFTFGISLAEIKEYLEKVLSEQCLSFDNGLMYWSNYLTDLDICEEDMTDPAVRFPRYLHTEFDCSEWRVQKRAEANDGSLMKETADKYRYLNYSVEKKFSIEILDNTDENVSGFYSPTGNDVAFGKEKVFRARRANGIVFAQIHLNYANQVIRIVGNYGYALTATEKKWIQPFLDSLAKTA